jgi:hypothetical protein
LHCIQFAGSWQWLNRQYFDCKIYSSSNSIPINCKENRKAYAKEKQEQKDFFGLFAMHLLCIPFAVKIVVHFVFNKTSPLNEAGFFK